MLDFTLAVTIIIAISEIIKRQGVPVRLIPLNNLFLGLMAGLFLLGLPWQEGLIQGILIGLSASGLYDQGKLIRGGK